MAKNIISRRQLLKNTIAAGTALTAASFLPAHWFKPVVMAGVLPAHAQTSVLAGSISGAVTLNLKPPQIGDLVGLFAAGDLATPLKTTTTDKDGHFAFSGLNPGLYDVAFEGKGWRYRSELNGQGHFITVKAGATADGDIVFPYPPE